MSHTSTISNVVISDVGALQAAVTELNANGVSCTLVKEGTPRAYYDNQEGMGRAEYVLKLNDATYDVGFYRNDQGSLEARTDFYKGSVEKQLSVQDEAAGEQARLGKLYNLYAIHATTRKAVQQGYNVRRVNNANGSVRLVVSA